MASAIKGFVKLLCEVCQTKTWHYSDKETVATVNCCTHNKPKKPEDIKVWGHVIQTEVDDSAKVALLEKKWKAGLESKMTDVVGRTYLADSPILKELGIEEPTVAERDYDTWTCSFCSKKFSHFIQETTGISNLKIEKVEVTTSQNPLVVEEKTKVTSRKVIACPNCAHLIKPLLHKDGSIRVMNSNGYDEG